MLGVLTITPVGKWGVHPIWVTEYPLPKIGEDHIDGPLRADEVKQFEEVSKDLPEFPLQEGQAETQEKLEK